MNKLKILEDNSLQNYNQYFDRGFDYLKQSVNHFQSISISVKERELLDGIKFNDFTRPKLNPEWNSYNTWKNMIKNEPDTYKYLFLGKD